MERDGQRFDQCSLFRGEIIWQAKDVFPQLGVGDADVLSEGTGQAKGNATPARRSSGKYPSRYAAEPVPIWVGVRCRAFDQYGVKALKTPSSSQTARLTRARITNTV
jgi:hypothetical protein